MLKGRKRIQLLNLISHINVFLLLFYAYRIAYPHGIEHSTYILRQKALSDCSCFAENPKKWSFVDGPKCKYINLWFKSLSHLHDGDCHPGQSHRLFGQSNMHCTLIVCPNQPGVNQIYLKVKEWSRAYSHCAFSSNLFHGQIAQIFIDQLSDPENKKCSP